MFPVPSDSEARQIGVNMFLFIYTYKRDFFLGWALFFSKKKITPITLKGKKIRLKKFCQKKIFPIFKFKQFRNIFSAFVISWSLEAFITRHIYYFPVKVFRAVWRRGAAGECDVSFDRSNIGGGHKHVLGTLSLSEHSEICREPWAPKKHIFLNKKFFF